ncbi:MAG: HAD-IA family hydrolase [Clostridia bacterium]|nr:HAD-IA family hydrolase [Clostridia bacterium]
MIKNFVFDIGNVLVDWHTMPYITGTLGCTEERARELDRIVFEGVEWKNGDRGLFSREDTRAALLERYPSDARDIIPLLDRADDILKEYTFNTDVLRKLRSKGYGVYYLSNTNPQAFEYMSANCGFFALMDGGIASFREKLLKPSHAIFELFAERFDKNPSECCFVDDTEVNTKAASEVGYSVITLRNPEDLAAGISEIIGAGL